MTREQAKESLYIDNVDCSEHKGMMKTFDADSIIDLIYNDVESRVCENCIYYKEYTPFGFGEINSKLDCTVNESGKNIVSFPHSNFGCNKFEREDSQ